MNVCKRIRPLIAGALYGELGAGELELVGEHLRSCSACAQTRDEIKATLQIMDRRERREPAEAFWEGFHARFAERRAEQTAAVSSPWDRLSRLVAHRWVLRPVAAVALVALGVLLGEWLSRREPPEPVPVAARVVPAPQPSTRSAPSMQAADERALQYLDRSKVLLLGLVNDKAGTSDPVSLPLDRERRVSEELASEAALLKGDLRSPGQRRLRELVTELEIILREIAHLDAAQDLPQIETVRGGIDRKGLLLKIDVEQMRLEARVEEEMPRAPSAERNKERT